MFPLETAYQQIERLVHKFKALSPATRRAYNEDNTRKDFILPFFRALEWDVYNAAEVSAEEKVSRGWVDFAFRIQGIPRFFLETKRIAEDLTKLAWVQQAIDYAWTKGVTWALLSDFEGLRVFNAEVKEVNPLSAQFIEFNIDTYLTDFDRLWWLSRPAMEAGVLSQEAEKWGKKVKKEPVSQHLFDDLKAWRSTLYNNLKGYNPLYAPAQVDEAVLRLLNRLIFIRTAEDRQVEEIRLLPMLRDLEKRGKRAQLPVELVKLFRELDAVYDSDLFAPHFLEMLMAASDPLPFRTVIEGLYEKPMSFVRYNFNALDADVLGTAYEQYLGHVVTQSQTDVREAHVEEKRQKRKSQGIYYTPTFVVKYIVQQTVDRWLDEQAYHPARPPRILDMACGSGSFLIEAFDVLDRRVAQQRGQHTDADSLQDYARRVELLTNCIYGVDKDEQAIAVAKLNLALKALHARDKLPMLANLRCGDSLISGAPETLHSLFGPDWRSQKPFDWRTEFSEVFTQGGFDVIIGNPPYIRGRSLETSYKKCLINTLPAFKPNADTYVAFIEQALKLLRPGGILGFIIPRSYLTEKYAEASRRNLLALNSILEIVDFQGIKVFEDATVTNVVIVIQKGYPSSSIPIRRWELETHQLLPAEIVLNSGDAQIRPEVGQKDQHLIEKIRQESILLDRLCYVSYSVAAHSEVENKKKDAYIFTLKKNEKCKRFIEAREISRYLIDYSGRWLEYDPKIVRRPGLPELFDAQKIMVRDVVGGQGLICSYDDSGLYADYSVVCLTLKSNLQNVTTRKITWSSEEINLASSYSLYYLLGLLNSSLLNYVFKTVIGGGLHVYPDNLRQLPIRTLNLSDPVEKALHDQMTALVTEMLRLQKEHAAAERQLLDERHALKRRLEQVDREMDGLVYRLYGLTEEEVGVVEGK